MKDNYYKKLLSIEEQKLYGMIYEAILVRQQSLDLHQDIDKKRIRLIIEAIRYDHPELFYFKSFSLEEVGFLIVKRNLKLEYYYVQTDIINKLSLLLKKRISKYISSVYKRVKNGSFEEFVCNKLIDSKNYSSTKDIMGLEHTALGTFAETRRSLDGFVLSVKYVFDQVGIDCIIVRGKRRQSEQVKEYLWNVIWIDGKAYNIDLWELFRKNAGYRRLEDICKSDDEIQNMYCKEEGFPHCVSSIERKHVLQDKVLHENKVEIPNITLPEIQIRFAENTRKGESKSRVIEEKYEGNVVKVFSDQELRVLVERMACVYPFDIAVQINYDNDLKKIASKISDYILSYFVKHGKLISISYKCFNSNNVIHIFSESVE